MPLRTLNRNDDLQGLALTPITGLVEPVPSRVPGPVIVFPTYDLSPS